MTDDLTAAVARLRDYPNTRDADPADVRLVLSALEAAQQDAAGRLLVLQRLVESMDRDHRWREWSRESLRAWEDGRSVVEAAAIDAAMGEGDA